MNTVPLSVLIDAVAAMKMLREVADEHLDQQKFMQALQAYASLKAHVEVMTNRINVEVPA